MITFDYILRNGINETIVTACASGTNAIGDAFKVIQRGDADIMLTGGTEAAITPMALAGSANSFGFGGHNAVIVMKKY